MAFRNTPKLIFPTEDFEDKIISRFGENDFYDGENWGTHLGTDAKVPEGTKIFSVGRGAVVYSKVHPGEFSPEGKILKRNWGGIVIIAHKNPKNKKVFYSLYGHLGKRFVKKGDKIEMGELIGEVGKRLSESNGAWDEEHLHLAIYAGPFHGKVLPGYFKKDQVVTREEYWSDPVKFIKNYLK